MTIRDCIFAVESLSHLQGKEAELLPLVEAAKKEHEALKAAARAANNLVFNMNEDKDGGYFLCEEASDDLFNLQTALEKLK